MPLVDGTETGGENYFIPEPTFSWRGSFLPKLGRKCGKKSEFKI